MTDWRTDRIGAARRGENPTLLARLPQSFAVIGDVQWLPGYCVLLTDDPVVTRLSELPRVARLEYLESVERLANAVETSCSAADSQFLRVNIEILGNTDPYLHTHIFPRYGWEPEELRRRPVWLYPEANWHNASTALGPSHNELRSAILTQLSHSVMQK